MSVSSFNDIREKVRESIRDTYGLLWDDDGLDELINEAQREYAYFSGLLTGVAAITVNAYNLHAAPIDFIEPIKYLDASGYELPILSWRYLHNIYPDFRTMTGTAPQGIIFNFDTYGSYRIFPLLPAGTDAGTIIYKKLPTDDVLETSNIEAIEQHCLYQMFMLTGKKATQNYFAGFSDAVNREARSMQTMRNRKTLRQRRYF